MQEIRVQSLGWENPLEEEMATPSSIFAWRIPWIEKPGGLQSMGSQRIRHDLATKPQPPKKKRRTGLIHANGRPKSWLRA